MNKRIEKSMAKTMSAHITKTPETEYFRQASIQNLPRWREAQARHAAENMRRERLGLPPAVRHPVLAVR